jgi:hypothetical protein
MFETKLYVESIAKSISYLANQKFFLYDWTKNRNYHNTKWSLNPGCLGIMF